MHIIGIMSGSSLDGLDIALCHFRQDTDWQYQIIVAECVPYSTAWTQRLRQLPLATAQQLWQTHADYGHLLGKMVQDFIEKHHLQNKVDLIGSHGHTIFHEPAQQMTCQIGDGAAIAHQTKLPVVCDFRTSDVAAHGQGAPMVPIADLHLFAQYRFCLNLGGIANISAKVMPNNEDELTLHNKVISKKNYSIVGFDVCYANQILDGLARQLGYEYDKDGMLATQGKLIDALLGDLNALDFGKMPYPKSLNNQQSVSRIMPIIGRYNASIEDKLHTFAVYMAQQIALSIEMVYQHEKIQPNANDSLLVTGGGAFNKFVIGQLQKYCAVQVVMPPPETVKFKEALLMAFAALLRWQGQANFIAAVTGAEHATIGGAVYLGK